jgi:hypothetical protein
LVFHVIVSPQVSRALGQLVADRTALLRILTRLRDQLETNPAPYRGQRDPDDPDLFEYVHYLYIGGQWFTFRFSVNDARATEYLFVEAVSRTP